MTDRTLKSHQLANNNLDEAYTAAQQNILQNKQLSNEEKTKRLLWLDQLCQFQLGQFLLVNKGLNGYWTHYILTYPWYREELSQQRSINNIELFLLNKSPIIKATQERFQLFLTEIQKSVIEGAKLACVPCGMLGELLYLTFSGIKHIELYGFDLDKETLQDARDLAKARGLEQFVQLHQSDAWQLGVIDEFDLLASNGLNIYVADDQQVTALYAEFYQALKPGGKLVASVITPPPTTANSGGWDIDKINQHDLAMQKVIVAEIIGAQWQHFRSEQLTEQQLRAVGFTDIQFFYDTARMFPMVVAKKPA